MVSLELKRIDSTIEKARISQKSFPTTRRPTAAIFSQPAQFWNRPHRTFFSPRSEKDRSSGNAQLYAGTTSEVVQVEVASTSKRIYNLNHVSKVFFEKSLAFVSYYLGSAVKSLAKQIAPLVMLLLTTSVVAQNAVQVEIEAVDVGNKSISVTHNGTSRKLPLGPNVEITIDGKEAILASLMPGSTASVTYDKGIAAVTSIAAQRTAILPAEKLAEGWDEIDDRLIFLMVRLASTEASLEATENAIAATSRNQTRKTGQVRQAENKNSDMDQKGGGPVKWSLFYGRAAESFFYHPTDRNSTYHTETILFQQYPVNDNQAGPGVPSRQGLPVHQRPPQFDYIYRANESAKARAEKDIAGLVGKTAELIERRQRLEAEQAGLWCEVAFRSVSHYDLDKKPLYRFDPLNATTDSDVRVQLETIRGAASFMALALSIVDAAQKDQPTTLSKIKPAISKARQDLNDAWLRIGVDVTDRKSVEGKFHALAKKLEESASNLSDSFVVALEGDMAKDQQRKDTFRGLLQESIIRYAEIILALDEMATLMKDDWQIKPDVDKPIQFVSLENVEAVLPVVTKESQPKDELKGQSPVDAVASGRPATPLDVQKSWAKLCGAYSTSDEGMKKQGLLMLGVGPKGAPFLARETNKLPTKRWKFADGVWFFDWGNIDLFAVKPLDNGSVLMNIYWKETSNVFDKNAFPVRNPDVVVVFIPDRKK